MTNAGVSPGASSGVGAGFPSGILSGVSPEVFKRFPEIKFLKNVSTSFYGNLEDALGAVVSGIYLEVSEETSLGVPSRVC